VIDGAAAGVVATDTEGAGVFEGAGKLKLNEELSIAAFESPPRMLIARPVAAPSGRFMERARRDFRLGARAPDMVGFEGAGLY